MAQPFKAEVPACVCLLVLVSVVQYRPPERTGTKFITGWAESTASFPSGHSQHTLDSDLGETVP